PMCFSRVPARLGVSAVVALDEDMPNLGFLSSHGEWRVPARVGPFLVFPSTGARALPQRGGARALGCLWRGAGGALLLVLWSAWRARGGVGSPRRWSVGVLGGRGPPPGACLRDRARWAF